jgi:hypothetical protein
VGNSGVYVDVSDDTGLSRDLDLIGHGAWGRDDQTRRVGDADLTVVADRKWILSGPVPVSIPVSVSVSGSIAVSVSVSVPVPVPIPVPVPVPVPESVSIPISVPESVSIPISVPISISVSISVSEIRRSVSIAVSPSRGTIEIETIGITRAASREQEAHDG